MHGRVWRRGAELRSGAPSRRGAAGVAGLTWDCWWHRCSRARGPAAGRPRSSRGTVRVAAAAHGSGSVRSRPWVVVAEWLRRRARNPLGCPRAGSSPADYGVFFCAPGGRPMAFPTPAGRAWGPAPRSVPLAASELPSCGGLF